MIPNSKTSTYILEHSKIETVIYNVHMNEYLVCANVLFVSLRRSDIHSMSYFLGGGGGGGGGNYPLPNYDVIGSNKVIADKQEISLFSFLH